MNVLITGAFEGLGNALLEELCELGHTVTALDIQKIECKKNVKSYVIDMADIKAVGEFVGQKNKNKGTSVKFDLVILNAGISATGKFEEIKASDHKKVLDVNLIAPLVLVSQLVGNERVSENGKIVMVSSLSHVTAYPGGATYAASKSAVAVYAKSIRKELKKKKIRILTVFPGPLDTQHATRYAPENAENKRRMKPQVMAKKIVKQIKGSKIQYYPLWMPRIIAGIGWICPRGMAKMMKIVLFNKMKKPRI